MPYVTASGVQVNFPFEPYQCQVTYMEKVIACLKDGHNGILESPTGTGKTLCLLCSSLAWLEDKKAQINSQRWRMAQSDPDSAVNDIKVNLSNQLDQAAGAWSGEFAPPKIIYASRTHSQLTQAIQELKRSAYRHFKVCVLGSREQLCIHPQVMREEHNSTKVHLCRSKVTNRTCHFYNNLDSQKHNFGNQVLDIEDLNKLGQRYNCCPYYAARELKAEADVIFMPYNYLLDPKSRKAHGVELNGNIIIFDEAHNLEKICEDSTSFDLKSGDIAAAMRELTQLSEKMVETSKFEDNGCADMMEAEGVIDQEFTLKDLLEIKMTLHNLEEKLDKIHLARPQEGLTKPGSYIFELLEEVGLSFESKNHTQSVLDKIVQHMSTDESGGVLSSRGNGLSKISDVLKIVFSREPEDFAAATSHKLSISKHYKVHIREEAPNDFKKKKTTWDTAPESSKKGRVLSYWCFSPGHAMEELRSHGVRSIILTSGTLSPLDSFKTEMGINFLVELENPHVIEPHQVWVGTLGKGPDGTTLNSSYQTRFNEDYQMSLGNAIVNFARVVPNGLLIFFPSYPVMNKCLETWQRLNVWSRIEQYKPVFVEPRNKHEFNTAMVNFYEKINDPTLNGAIFAAVCRGKVSEGLDFADINGRAVVITGLPFPPRMDPKVMLKMKFLDEMRAKNRKGLTGQLWYRQQASRAVNQAIGRVIRHRHDYGAIILCDNRFGQAEAVAQLSSWVRPHMTNYPNFGNGLRNVMMFFKNAEKVMPAPNKGKKKPSQPGSLGCQGAYFAQSVTRTVATDGQKASTVAMHVPSLQARKDSSEISLAKLKVQYEMPNPGGASSSGWNNKKQSLLDALDKHDDKIPSYQLPSSSKSHPNVDKSKKKKILIKSTNKCDVTKDNLQSAENYLAEVKQTLSGESYKYFSKTLAGYKKTGEFTAMISCLADIFTDEENKYHLFRRFYRFVRPHHKQQFDQTCKEIIGQGCGYKPEHSISKKRLAAESVNQAQDPEKKRQKLESLKTSKDTNMDTKTTTKNQPLGEVIANIASKHLDSTTHLSHGAAQVVPSSSKNETHRNDQLLNHNLSSQKEPQVTSTKKQGVKSIRAEDMERTTNDKNKMKSILTEKEKIVNCDSSQNSGGSIGSGDLFDQNSNNSSGSDPSQSKEKKSDLNSDSSATFERAGSEESEKRTSSIDKISAKPTMSPQLEAYLLGPKANSGYTCSKCGQEARVPLKAPCEHVCCMDCWKDCIREEKKCPACDLKVKRKHLSRIFFPSGPNLNP